MLLPYLSFGYALSSHFSKFSGVGSTGLSVVPYASAKAESAVGCALSEPFEVALLVLVDTAFAPLILVRLLEPFLVDVLVIAASSVPTFVLVLLAVSVPVEHVLVSALQL